jgi:peptidoglycan/xylan/chitin deacetylase (PgdA/CDA1 family)
VKDVERKYNREVSSMLASVVGAVVAGVLAGIARGAVAPKSQLFGRTFCRGRDDCQIALTYDDGPNDHETLDLLELLAKYSAKASFFVVGKHVKIRPQIVRDIVEQGHAIGNHTFTHRNLLWASPEDVRDELQDCQRIVEDVTGVSPGLFRPPYGARRPDTLWTARKLKLMPVMWTATCFDWKPTSAESVVAEASKDIDKAGFGSVILLHDGDHRTLGADRKHSIKATRQILEKYKPQGFTFVTVTEMMCAAA